MNIELIVAAVIVTLFISIAVGVLFSIYEVKRSSVLVERSRNDKGEIIESYINPRSSFLNDKENQECIEIKKRHILLNHPSAKESIIAAENYASAEKTATSYVIRTFGHKDDNVSTALVNESR